MFYPEINEENLSHKAKIKVIGVGELVVML